MLCSRAQLVNPGIDYDDVRLLPCNSWRCDRCGPRRQMRLAVLAASGSPTAKIEITIRATADADPQERLKSLHRTWKLLVKRMLRQFALPPNNRWAIAKERTQQVARRVAIANSKVAAKEITKIHYLAVVEAHPGSGQPHLHILARIPFVPQDWIAEQCADIADSPVCWIEKIKSLKAASRYVAKYVTKQPQQFGTAKRYWFSRDYVPAEAKQKPTPIIERRQVQYVKKDFTSWAKEMCSSRWQVYPLPDGWLRVYSPVQTMRWAETADLEDVGATIRAVFAWRRETQTLLGYPSPERV